MTPRALATPRNGLLLLAALCALWVVIVNGPNVDEAVGPFREMILFERDEASTANGVWIMWSQRTIDFEEPMKTGFYHYSTLLLGALAAPFHVPGLEHFAVAARVNSLLEAVVTIVVITWAAGSLSGWSWGVAVLPVFLATSAAFNNHAASIRVDMAMWLWQVLSVWAMTRFLVEPGRRWFTWSMVLITLAFAAKPSVLLLYILFIAINAYQVFRDGEPFWREFRWRLGRGLLCFFGTMLVATPNTVFSFGLFVASLRSEIDMSSKKYVARQVWEWLTFLVSPDYLGTGYLLIVGALLAGFLWHRWRVRRQEGPATRDPIIAFIWINLAWTLGFWAFLLFKSRSFIVRYLDPGWITFLLLWAALLAYWLRRERRVGLVALAASFVAIAATLPANWNSHARQLAHMASFDENLAPKRKFMAEFEQIVPAGAALLASPETMFDSERYPKSHRFFRFRPRYFRIRPEYLITSQRRMNFHAQFLDKEVTEQNEHDVERKATVIFYKALAETNLWGTVEPVRTWEDLGAVLYRFKEPVTDAYIRWLSAKVYAGVGVAPPAN